ncbi:MAG: SDR family NAD(P)-dependent oxidoreductase [Eubacteriales bacterium]|nr:SDR family NAD(P)-dependent oxidoreductase [Eubacteriales bacterium]MDY3332979.1 SDR family NAD(P)-dependent oxidoreductase [Gallibacter sp.]
MEKMKTVLITGASRGIGREAALVFARAGFLVFINTRKSIEQLSSLENEINNTTDGRAISVIGDVGNIEDVDKIFKEISFHTDKLDALINNAGISYIGLFDLMTDNEWDDIVSSNLSSVFYCSKRALKLMIPFREGKIINISSIWGKNGAACEVAYSATKYGINGLTVALSKEVASYNISINAVAFGVIDTDMNSIFSDNDRKEILSEIPYHRFATAKEAGEFIYEIYKLPQYMTGEIIGFDGGFK